MKFKVGDKVKFLNEKGGGIISKIVSGHLVNVAIDEGFDIPVLAKELILIENNTVGERFFAEQFAADATSQQRDDEMEAAQDAANQLANQPFDIAEGVYIAIVPDDQNNLIIGDVEVFLLNNTSYDLIFTLYLKNKGKYIGLDYGNIKKYAEASLQVTDREDLNYFGLGVMQMLFFKDSISDLIPPANLEFRIKMTKLLKEDNYIVNNVFSRRAYIHKLSDTPEIDVKDAQANALPGKNHLGQVKKDSVILIHKVEEGFAEIDLHIDALCENPSSISNQQKLQLQLDYFTRCLESGIAENFKRLIFIHGVGAGVLKIELKKILDEYSFLEYFDASIAKYGIGATEVLIHQNNKDLNQPF
ncbi:MAG: DUF2027 domain-containing protein [Bacteroidota bacterium]